MKFHQFRPLYRKGKFLDRARINGLGHFVDGMSDIEAFYSLTAWACKNSDIDENERNAVINRCAVEMAWMQNGRPYFHVYPCIVEAAEKTPMHKIKLSDLSLPECCRVSDCRCAVEVDFGYGYEYATLGACLLCIIENDDGKKSLEIALERESGGSCFKTPLDAKGVEYCLESDKNSSAGVSMRDMIGIAKLVYFSTMLIDDDDFCSRDVLAKDRAKYENADAEAKKTIEERAKRRGKNGWVFGERMESIPHLRRPHFAIRWTGEGRKVPLLRPIKGSVVHRKKLAEVPTGFRDKETKEVG